MATSLDVSGLGRKSRYDAGPLEQFRLWPAGEWTGVKAGLSGPVHRTLDVGSVRGAEPGTTAGNR